MKEREAMARAREAKQREREAKAKAKEAARGNWLDKYDAEQM